MDMVKTTLLFVATAVVAVAQDFSIQLGSPAALEGSQIQKKGSLFSIRLQGCADLAAARVSGKAESPKGATVDLVLFPAGAGRYAVGVGSQITEPWIAVISAECGNAKAGALIPIENHTYIREAAKFVTHTPTKAEVEAALKSNPGKSDTGGSR